MRKVLILVGALLIAAGLLWPWIGRLGLGRLPGDIVIHRDGFSFYFPITSMILISIALTLIIRLFGK
ncbi:MAG: DUF2905 family protein [Alphaproteobacteria bacterium]|nr:DUF2905 family protein [Alphaproteobacteria bacterium]